MMPMPWLVVAAVVLACDAALRPWGKRAAHSAVYLLLAYGPLLVVPSLGKRSIAALAAVIALVALWSFGRMVGLTQDLRFFVPTLLVAAAFHLVALFGWYGLFQAMPVFAIFSIIGAATMKGDPRAFLQKMCLSWLSLLVWGYLWGHAAVYVRTDFGRLGDGGFWIATTILLAKCGDVAWVATHRLKRHRETWQPVVPALGSTIGAAILFASAPSLLTLGQHIALGAFVGAGLGFASRAYNLIVDDVLGERGPAPLKGTMMFGFAFSLALAYHWLRYLS